MTESGTRKKNQKHFDSWQSKMIFSDQVFGQVADMRSSGVGRLVYLTLLCRPLVAEISFLNNKPTERKINEVNVWRV